MEWQHTDTRDCDQLIVIKIFKHYKKEVRLRSLIKTQSTKWTQNPQSVTAAINVFITIERHRKAEESKYIFKLVYFKLQTPYADIISTHSI